MSKIQVHVKVDVHEEKAPQIVEEVSMHPEVKSWSFGPLEAGDLEITTDDSSDVVLFERKTPNDYAGTLTGKEGHRLNDQIGKLKEHADDAHILIEGNLEDFDHLTRTNIQPSSCRGSIASVQQRHFDVMLCSNAEILVDMAVRLARKYFEDPSRSSLEPSIIERNAPFVKRTLGCLDGIGPGTVETIYERYKSLDVLLSVDEEELQELDGIGEKRAASIVAQLHEGQ